jgi:ABC-type nitrate/sulfonate/bicarbonate transport system permease component
VARIVAIGTNLARWSPVLALLLVWETLARSGLVTPFMLPPFSAVLRRIGTDALSGDLLLGLEQTLYRTLAGFGLAAAGGIVLGALIARYRPVRWFFDPLISVGFPMPKIAFLPVIALWLGYQDVSKISMIVFDSIFPVLTATIAGTAGVDKALLWSARSLGVGPQRILWEIVLPAALPEILTGLQVALPIALIVAIVAEMTMGGIGLGAQMMTATRFADSPGVFAGIVEIAVAGYAMMVCMAFIRRRLLAWHAEVLAPAAA